MVVLGSILPIFAFPNVKSEQIDEMLFGDSTEILEKSAEFCKIRTDYGYIGWVEAECLSPNHVEPTHTVAVPFADLLSEDRYFRPAELTLPFGAKIKADFSRNHPRFASVFTPNGEFYIHKSHISPINISPKAAGEDIAAVAKKYLGVQYRWGGRTHLGIDCSGLCFNSYRFCGANIWRDAKFELSPNLRSIEYSSAKIGDILFFKGHVAIYLGNGKIIHSSATRGGVVIEKFEDNPYLKEIYICTGTLF